MDDGSEHVRPDQTDDTPAAAEGPDPNEDLEPAGVPDRPAVDERTSEPEEAPAEEPEDAMPEAPAEEPEGATQPEPDQDEDEEPTAPLTLDELVAELEVPAEESGEHPAEEPGEETSEEAAEAAEGEEAGEEEAETAEPGEQEIEAGLMPVSERLWTRLPFWLIGLAWAAFSGALAYLFWPLSATVFVTNPLYPYFVFGGAALVVVDLVTGLVVLLVARARAGDEGRAGLGRVIWLRALTWTAAGVVLWWVALIALDLHRTGVIR